MTVFDYRDTSPRNSHKIKPFLRVFLQAWAQFKGKLTDEELNNPASWKTRLRCALNKSPEFCEVNERSQLDISEPYKVYRLVPISEQGQSSEHTQG